MFQGCGGFWPVGRLSGGAELIFRGKVARGIRTIAFFSAFPFIWGIDQATDISWAVVGPFIMIALGAFTLVKSFYLKDEPGVNGEMD